MREAQNIQAASAFNMNLLLDKDSRLLHPRLNLTIQQKPNARIDRARTK
jgi:hypothetical protein